MGDGRVAYVALTIGGVQEFIGAARRTIDLWTASRLMSHLSQAAAEAIGGQLVLPGPTASGAAFPNRVVATVPVGTAAERAEAGAAATRRRWNELATAVHGLNAGDGKLAPSLATFPDVRWVAWEPPEGSTGDLIEAWRLLGEALVARKRAHTFPAYTGLGRQVCSLCGLRDRCDPPGGLNRRRGEELCAVCAVKRDAKALSHSLGDSLVRFPSTASIASAPFRRRVIDALALPESAGLQAAMEKHRQAVEALRTAFPALSVSTPHGAYPGLDTSTGARAGQAKATASDWASLDGTWCYPDSWSVESIKRELPSDPPPDKVEALTKACSNGRTALSHLMSELLALTDVSSTPATYLALLAQDADHMGDRIRLGLAGAQYDPAAWLRDVSTALMASADKQSSAVEGLLGRTVYAGGDDLLALLPLSSALEAAGTCNQLFLDRLRPLVPRASASAALLCFHISYPLQEAVQRARDALHEAKGAGRDRLAVVVLRRGGERARTMLPWEQRGRSAAGTLAGLAAGFGAGLSAGLMTDMAAERHGLAGLSGPTRGHRQELARLVGRHGPSHLLDLVNHLEPLKPRGGPLGPEDIDAWVDGLQVARFLSQEAR